MTVNVYPPAGRWRDLTAAQQADRLDHADDLLNVLQLWRGDARLTAWEEGFLTSLVRLTQEFHGKARITPKQWDKLRQIIDRLELSDADVSSGNVWPTDLENEMQDA